VAFRPLVLKSFSGVQENEIQSFSSSNGNFIVKSHVIIIDLISTDEVEVLEKFEIENQSNDSVSCVNLRLNPKCEDIQVQDLHTFSELMIDHWALTVNFQTNLSTEEAIIIYINYNLKASVSLESKPNHYRFQYISFITYLTLNHSMLIQLPEGSFLDSEIATNTYPPGHIVPIAPTKRIAISWFQEDVTRDQLFFVIFEPQLENQITFWFSIFSPFTGIIIGIIGTLYVMRKKERKSVKEIGTVFLNESQKLLLRAIQQKGGKIAQNELSRELGFTRSKTSRNLISLEKQGLVRREQWGRNTLVFITKTGEKVVE
jgi:uncharacterized membrane protein